MVSSLTERQGVEVPVNLLFFLKWFLEDIEETQMEEETISFVGGGGREGGRVIVVIVVVGVGEGKGGIGEGEGDGMETGGESGRSAVNGMEEGEIG